MTRISIIMATYNYAHYIVDAIHSISNQQDPDYEIIIVDDGSTDETAEIVKKQMLNNVHLHYYDQHNQGPAAARNKGISVATGDYLLFLDADDQLLPQSLNAFRSAIQKNPQADVIIAGHMTMQVNGQKKSHIMKPLATNRLKNFTYYLHKKFSLQGGYMLFKREVFKKLAYPEDLRVNEDVVLFSHALAMFNCIGIPNIVMSLRKHPNSLRNQHQINKEIGFKVIDNIFNPKILPEEFMRLKNDYYASRCLALSRAFVLSGEIKQARQYYWEGVKKDPRQLLKISYLKRIIFSYFKSEAKK